MSRQEAKSQYDQLNGEAIAALARMRNAVDRQDHPAVEREDKIVSQKLTEMRALMRAL
jgi:anionic cell wall polymer biosynthesis LytR-Cps2A-Psr (LCP) family protein